MKKKIHKFITKKNYNILCSVVVVVAKKQETEATTMVMAIETTSSKMAANRISCSSHSVETNTFTPSKTTSKITISFIKQLIFQNLL
uniref:Uncharacterized protein n=1 Tax=Cannabis sativa TaxID=3483 RepID=A0A803R2I3_CANSA